MGRDSYSHQKESRKRNASLLLHDIWYHAPITKAMLAERNGLTKATVSAICRDLVAQDLIRSTGLDRGGMGRPGDLIELNASARCSIGVEISTNYIGVVLANLCGEILWRSYAPLEIGSGQEVVITRVKGLIDDAIRQTQQFSSPLLGIGVGVPGVVDDFVNAPALGWKEVPLKTILEQRFKVPVIVDNKARAAAMIEALHGHAREVDNFIYVSIGTDVHSNVEAAVVNDGHLFRGTKRRAVNAGHMILDPYGPLCACGQRGCWSALVDVGREVELARQRLLAGEASSLQAYSADGFASLEHRAIHQAAVEGDPLARSVASYVILNHAIGITNLVLLFDPQLVVIGWETLAIPPSFTARMHFMESMPEFDIVRAVCENLIHREVTPPNFAHTRLEPDVVMLGAAAMLIDAFLHAPPFDND